MIPYGQRKGRGAGWWWDITPLDIRKQFLGKAASKRARRKAKREISKQLEETKW